MNNFRFLTKTAGYTLTRMAPFHAQGVVPVTAGNGSVVVVFGAQAVREVLTDNDTFHRVGDGLFAVPPGRPYSKMFQAVLTANGAEHRRRRQLLMPMTHKTAMRSYEQIFAETFAASRLATAGTEPFDLVDDLLMLSKTNMLRCLLGLEVTDANLALTEKIVSLTAASINPMVALVRWDRPWLPYGRWVADIATVYTALAELIEQRRGQRSRTDVLSILCNTTDENGDHLPAEEIAGEVHGLFAAGFHTTAMALVWALVLLSTDGRDLDLGDPEVLVAGIKESQRLLPSAAASLPQYATREVSIAGSPPVPPGALVFASPAVEHHNPQVYPDPFVFQPDRWLRADTTPSVWEFLPFGVGMRRCLGAAFADQQIKTTLELLGARGRVPKLLTGKIDCRTVAGVTTPRGPIMASYGDTRRPARISGSVTQFWQPR